MTVQKEIGIWKSGSGKGKKTPRGRQAQNIHLEEISKLLGDKPRRKDLLIEFLHLIQDKFGCINFEHVSALAEELKLAQAEIYEVATFYAHFDGKLRVCCHGSALLAGRTAGENGSNKRLALHCLAAAGTILARMVICTRTDRGETGDAGRGGRFRV